MKLRWTPRERCTPEQSMHRKTPYVMLAQLGFLAPQSKQAWAEKEMSERSVASSRGRALTTQEEKPAPAAPAVTVDWETICKAAQSIMNASQYSVLHNAAMVKGCEIRKALKRIGVSESGLSMDCPYQLMTSETKRRVDLESD